MAEFSLKNNYRTGTFVDTPFCGKNFPLKARARKYSVSLHFLSECHWCELTMRDFRPVWQTSLY